MPFATCLAQGLPGGGELKEETSFLNQIDVAPEGCGIVENATPKDRHLLVNWERGDLPEFAERSAAAGGRCHPWKGPLRLIQKISMSRVLDVAIQDTGNNRGRTKQSDTMRMAQLRKGAGGAQLPLGTNRNRAR